MYNVRHYDKVIHPDTFKQGVMGWWIRCLNFLRWKLEVYIQSCVLKYLCKEAGHQPEQKKRYLDAFRIDVKKEKLEKEELSPNVSSGGQEVTRGERYRTSTFAKNFDKLVEEQQVVESAKETIDELPNRPETVLNLLSRYSEKTRASRYAKGRKRFVVIEEEDTL